MVDQRTTSMQKKKSNTTAPAEPPRVGATLAAIRQSRSLSLDTLSKLAGVSKSMLSQIERNRANPTVAVVWRLANALGVPLAELLGAAAAEKDSIQIIPGHATPVMRSPDGKCELRVLGPIELAGRFEWYELTIQPGGTLDSAPHARGAREHLTVVSGRIDAVSGDVRHSARPQDTLRYSADIPHSLRNPGKVVALAFLLVELA